MTKKPTAQSARPREALPLGPRVAEVLRIAYHARKPVLLEGPTGIGKSQIVAQVARALGIDFRVLDLSLLEPPDLVGLPVLSGGVTDWAQPATLPDSGAGLLMLEELNRAERYVQQPALQLLSARRLHQYELPAGWSLVAAVNPEGGDYFVNALDPALRARFLQVVVRPDRSAWLRWARENCIHFAILKLALTQDHLLDDVPPRSWAYASDVLKALMEHAPSDERLLRDVLSGYLPPVWIEALHAACGTANEVIDVDVHLLLSRYASDAQLQGWLAGLREQGRSDVIAAIVHRLQSVLADDAEAAALVTRGELDLASFERLLSDLPGDLAEALQAAFGACPAVAALLEVEPPQVLRSYRGGAAARTVERWLAERNTRHRAWALAAAVAVHVARNSSSTNLRRSVRARDGLACLLAQLGAEAGAPLRAVMQRLGLDALL